MRIHHRRHNQASSHFFCKQRQLLKDISYVVGKSRTSPHQLTRGRPPRTIFTSRTMLYMIHQQRPALILHRGSSGAATTPSTQTKKCTMPTNHRSLSYTTSMAPAGISPKRPLRWHQVRRPWQRGGHHTHQKRKSYHVHQLALVITVHTGMAPVENSSKPPLAHTGTRQDLCTQPILEPFSTTIIRGHSGTCTRRLYCDA